MSDKPKAINLLSQLIKYHSNDLLMDIDANYATKETEKHLTNLIIGIARYLHDIRYCSNPDCECSPEQAIKRSYVPIKEYLQRTKYALHPIPYWEIEEMLAGGLNNE